MTAHRLFPIILAASVLVAGCAAIAPASAPTAGEADAHQKYDETVESFDGTLIAITVFRPEGASADAPVPVVVRSHGWSLSRDTEIGGMVEAFLDAGFGVVTFDARGHGDSGGVARVHDPDFEIRDVSVLLDWMHDNLAWALQQEGSGFEKDLVLGASGGSYGGGWQLLTAGIDGRLDALAPEITWNSLPRSLAPGGAVKSGWVAALYGAGKAQARLHEDIDRWLVEGMATNEFPADADAHFAASSVYPYVGNVRAPTLLVQGVPDTLFNLNEAVDTYDSLVANGTPARLFTHLGGHLLAASFVAGFVPGADGAPLPDAGVPQPGDGGSPCGDVQGTIVAWFNAHLKGGAAPPGPRVAMAMDDGSCLPLDALPAADLEIGLGVPVVLPPMVGSVVLPLVSAGEGGMRLAGIPVLSVGSATVIGVDDIAYVSLVVQRADGSLRTLSSQVTPVRLGGPEMAGGFVLELGGVGAVLAPGDELALRVDRVNEFFAANSGRTPSALVLDEVTLALPVVLDA